MAGKTVILISQFDDVENWVKNYLHNREVKKIAFITDAKSPRLEVEPDYMFADKKVLEAAGFAVDFIKLASLSPSETSAKLAGYDAIYVKGGNAFVLLDAMRKSGFSKIAKKLIDQGIIYIGESAGAYVACPTIEIASWKHQDRNIIGLKNLTALGLVPFLVTAHYTPEYQSVIDAEAAKSEYEVKRLTDKDLILIEDSKVRQITI